MTPDNEPTAAAQMLEQAGRMLFGEDWQAQLAIALNVRRDTIRKFLHGTIPFDFRHGVWSEILKLLEQRQAELRTVEIELRKCLKHS